MTNTSLAQSYLLKAEKRLKILPVLLNEAAYSDVVREAQEIVELALKGMLRQVGIEPPKLHGVGALLVGVPGPVFRTRPARSGAAGGDLRLAPERARVLLLWGH